MRDRVINFVGLARASDVIDFIWNYFFPLDNSAFAKGWTEASLA